MHQQDVNLSIPLIVSTQIPKKTQHLKMLIWAFILFSAKSSQIALSLFQIARRKERVKLQDTIVCVHQFVLSHLREQFALDRHKFTKRKEIKVSDIFYYAKCVQGSILKVEF